MGVPTACNANDGRLLRKVLTGPAVATAALGSTNGLGGGIMEEEVEDDGAGVGGTRREDGTTVSSKAKESALGCNTRGEAFQPDGAEWQSLSDSDILQAGKISPIELLVGVRLPSLVGSLFVDCAPLLVRRSNSTLR